MGGAMLRSWIKNDIIATAHIMTPSPLSDDLTPYKNIHHIPDASNHKIESNILILAVKPQIIADVSRVITPNLSKDTIILSIIAGQSLDALTRIFGANRPIIRCMPNTPASIGKGISVAIANNQSSDLDKTCATQLLSCSGECIWIEDESQMNAVTALSGSGPAYIFHLIEIMAKAGESIGLPRDISMKLARQTVIGSAALAEHDSDIPASTLRENVTSPGGTTQAALNVLMNGNKHRLSCSQTAILSEPAAFFCIIRRNHWIIRR